MAAHRVTKPCACNASKILALSRVQLGDPRSFHVHRPGHRLGTQHRVVWVGAVVRDFKVVSVQAPASLFHAMLASTAAGKRRSSSHRPAAAAFNLLAWRAPLPSCARCCHSVQQCCPSLAFFRYSSSERPKPHPHHHHPLPVPLFPGRVLFTRCVEERGALKSAGCRTAHPYR